MNNDVYEKMSLREHLRLKLIEANALVTNIEIDELQGKVLSPDEILVLGQLLPDARTSTELIDEDKGIY